MKLLHLSTTHTTASFPCSVLCLKCQPVCPHVLLILYTFKRQNMNQQPCSFFFSNKLQNDSASWPRCQVVPDDWAAFQYTELIFGCVQKYSCQTKEFEWQGFSRSRIHVTNVPVFFFLRCFFFRVESNTEKNHWIFIFIFSYNSGQFSLSRHPF